VLVDNVDAAGELEEAATEFDVAGAGLDGTASEELRDEVLVLDGNAGMKPKEGDPVALPPA
jgi:hypothetical protein